MLYFLQLLKTFKSIEYLTVIRHKYYHLKSDTYDRIAKLFRQWVFHVR